MGKSHSPSQPFMPDTSLAPASQAIVSVRASCPLCASSARREIDTLIYALQRRAITIHNTDTGETVDIDREEPADFSEIFDKTNELLAKLPEHKTEPFGLDELIIHASRHPLASQIAGLPVKSEGALLFAGADVYNTPDLKDFLRYVIVKAIAAIESGNMKISPTFALNATALLWRMSGDSGSNDFLNAIRDKVTTEKIDPTSPLGSAYEQREQVRKAQGKSTEEES